MTEEPDTGRRPGPNSRDSAGSSPMQILRTLRHPGRFLQQHILDPGFAHNPRRYLVQAALAALAMLLILIFVDSLSNAALAAGLASSVLYSSTRTAALPASAPFAAGISWDC